MNLTEEERQKVIRSLEKAAGDTGEYPTEEEIEVACEKVRRAKVQEKNEWFCATWGGCPPDFSLSGNDAHFKNVWGTVAPSNWLARLLKPFLRYTVVVCWNEGKDD